MPKSKIGIAIDQLFEALRELPILKAIGKRDKRSIPKAQRLTKELSGVATPSQIAKEMGISTQKYVALRGKVERGEVASPILSDVLEQVAEEFDETPRLIHETFVADVKGVGRRIFEVSVWESPISFIQNNVSWAKDIKPGGFASRKSALNWLGNVGGAAEYFVVVRKKTRDGRIRYHIYDIRTPSELAKKGKLKGKLRAEKILEKYGRQ